MPSHASIVFFAQPAASSRGAPVLAESEAPSRPLRLPPARLPPAAKTPVAVQGRTLARMRTRTSGLHLVLLLDASADMVPYVEPAVAAFNQQVEQAHRLAFCVPRLQVSVVQFAETVNIRLCRAHASALQSLRLADYAPAGPAALYDALHAALGLVLDVPLSRAPAADALVVLISDGADDASHTSLAQLARLLHRFEACRAVSFLFKAPPNTLPTLARSLPSAGLDELRAWALTPTQLGVALGHIAHRRTSA